jgi:hypothetical protein
VTVGTLDTREPGVLASAIFDPQGKNVRAELEAFGKKLDALKEKLGLDTLVVARKREGRKVRFKVLAGSRRPPAQSSEGWAANSK